MWPSYAQDEINAVVRVLKSGKVNQWTGKEVEAFQDEFASYVGTQYAVAFANGSLALEAAWSCLPGVHVKVPARSFVATAFSALRAGKRIQYIDVNREGLASEYVTCKVHLGGKVSEVDCEMEDCAQAMGARYSDGAHVGSTSKIGVFSFCQDKILSTGGEGGMCVTNDYLTYRALWAWKDHGKNWEKSHADTKGAYNYCHTTLGTNARMTEMQAAIGRRQLPKVAGWVKKRRAQAEILAEALDALPCLRIERLRGGDAAYRFYAYTIPDRLRDLTQRDHVLRLLLRAKFPVGQGSCPEMYREQAVYTGFDNCPVAKDIGMTALAWKTDPTISIDDWTKMARKSAEIVRSCQRFH